MVIVLGSHHIGIISLENRDLLTLETLLVLLLYFQLNIISVCLVSVINITAN